MVGHNMFLLFNCNRIFNQLRRKNLDLRLAETVFVNCLMSVVSVLNVGESKTIFRASGITPVVHDNVVIL